MPISKHPERSYWECEWKFPPTGEKVFISLRGIESGPAPDVRKFYLSLPGRFPEILAVCRPGLEQVFNEWLNRRLPAEMFSDLKLSGFGVEVPFIQPIHWDVSFETTGNKWLGITIPFVGDAPQEPEVDT